MIPKEDRSVSSDRDDGQTGRPNSYLDRLESRLGAMALGSLRPALVVALVIAAAILSGLLSMVATMALGATP